jgi:hypothetical protein
MPRPAFIIALCFGGFSLMTIASCDRTDQVAIDAHAQLVQDAVALIEKHNPIH